MENSKTDQLISEVNEIKNQIFLINLKIEALKNYTINFEIMKKYKGKLTFSGNGLNYFLISIGWLILVGLTFGILLPAWIFWSMKFFAENTSIELEEK